MLGSYLFNKNAVSLNNGLNTASELGAGSHDHFDVQTGLVARGMLMVSFKSIASK